MSLSSPESALHHNVEGHITEEELFCGPTEGPFEKNSDHYCHLYLFTFHAIFIERKAGQIRKIMTSLEYIFAELHHFFYSRSVVVFFIANS